MVGRRMRTEYELTSSMGLSRDIIPYLSLLSMAFDFLYRKL
jgi:hypothetical protein